VNNFIQKYSFFYSYSPFTFVILLLFCLFDFLKIYRSYELSQDLLDKQIELLERKYGGVRARRAAIIIQRAFRHYKMVKKFASITAMVKAEKRLSNRSSMQPFIREYNNDISNKSSQTMRVCAM
jgi:hypothetical protein